MWENPFQLCLDLANLLSLSLWPSNSLDRGATVEGWGEWVCCSLISAASQGHKGLKGEFTEWTDSATTSTYIVRWMRFLSYSQNGQNPWYGYEIQLKERFRIRVRLSTASARSDGSIQTVICCTSDRQNQWGFSSPRYVGPFLNGQFLKQPGHQFPPFMRSPISQIQWEEEVNQSQPSGKSHRVKERRICLSENAEKAGESQRRRERRLQLHLRTIVWIFGKRFFSLSFFICHNG